MSENRSVSPKNKLKAVEEYLAGKGSMSIIAQKYRVSRSAFRGWLTKYKVSYQQIYSLCRKYEANGVEALQDQRGRKKARGNRKGRILSSSKNEPIYLTIKNLYSRKYGSISELCDVAGIARSSYYKWLNKGIARMRRLTKN